MQCGINNGAVHYYVNMIIKLWGKNVDPEMKSRDMHKNAEASLNIALDKKKKAGKHESSSDVYPNKGVMGGPFFRSCYI